MNHLGVVVLVALATAGTVQAQVPPLIETELVKMGRVVGPRLHRETLPPLVWKKRLQHLLACRCGRAGQGMPNCIRAWR